MEDSKPPVDRHKGRFVIAPGRVPPRYIHSSVNPWSNRHLSPRPYKSFQRGNGARAGLDLVWAAEAPPTRHLSPLKGLEFL
ncbi:hypothetical protein PGT21_023245 [Puccinia graminis f. sp. tritici]|uniref:Uncharacterized protein n=1 Tax=Puccinia graminis f. sp. tritici TaxID=56615 RepID=A0A5B0PIK9_PUCGR|nr:hypothetical protein PGT21_023245 [Puccinia graminis f. sp. tritici]KAA1100783.1 hypothetical protein PGTUg99_026973 [Puccinia graminis f. sp. tritici]